MVNRVLDHPIHRTLQTAINQSRQVIVLSDLQHMTGKNVSYPAYVRTEPDLLKITSVSGSRLLKLPFAVTGERIKNRCGNPTRFCQLEAGDNQLICEEPRGVEGL